MIYLATPYSHPSSHVREWRYQQACALWRAYMAEEPNVFSPIVHAHPTACRYGMPTDYEFWARWNHAILGRCDELWIAEVAGWDSSAGIKAERNYAQNRSIPWKLRKDARVILAAAGLLQLIE